MIPCDNLKTLTPHIGPVCHCKTSQLPSLYIRKLTSMTGKVEDVAVTKSRLLYLQGRKGWKSEHPRHVTRTGLAQKFLSAILIQGERSEKFQIHITSQAYFSTTSSRPSPRVGVLLS